MGTAPLSNSGAAERKARMAQGQLKAKKTAPQKKVSKKNFTASSRENKKGQIFKDRKRQSIASKLTKKLESERRNQIEVAVAAKFSKGGGRLDLKHG